MEIRWVATIVYRTDAGPVDIVHDLSEIGDLHTLVEQGPHWDCIIQIKVERVNHVESETLTVEQAERL